MSDEPQMTAAEYAYEAFIAAAKAYAPHMDQFDKVKFDVDYGWVYVTIGRADLYPDTFDDVTTETEEGNGTA